LDFYLGFWPFSPGKYRAGLFTYYKQTVEKSDGFCLHLHGATKPFFVNNKNLKVNAKRYKTHLEKALLPSTEQQMN